MDALWNHRWLLAGAAAGVLVPWAGLHRTLPALLGAAAPLPWGSLALGLLLFIAASALHFRSQWVASLGHHRELLERQEAAARRIAAAERDGMRWLRVIQENLELVDSQGAQRLDGMYLSGARAHADKLEQAFARIGGTRRRLQPGGDGDEPARAQVSGDHGVVPADREERVGGAPPGHGDPSRR